MSKLVPELRFKEFSGEWEEKALNKICTINPVIGSLPNKFIYIDLESVVAGHLLKETEIYKDDAPSRAQRLLENGDVIYQMVRPYQKNNLFFNFDNAKDYVASTGYAQLRATDSNSFLYQLIHIDSFVNKVLENSTGSNYPAINSKDLAKIAVIVPKPKEQQKIANCLSSLDSLIEAQNKKVEALKKHKKGLMQQLFPSEGETVPKLRFDGFSGEWEEKAFNKICDINPTIGKLPNNFIYIDLESVISGKLLLEKEIKKENAPSRAQRLLLKGDVIYQMVRPYQKNNLFFNFDNNRDYVASTGYAQLRAFDSNSFLYQLIHIDTFVNKVLEQSTGSNYPAINSKDLAKIMVRVPKLPEQQKIANCLSALDSLIEAQNKKIEALKAHKKGLMQQLFVSSEVDV